MRSRILVHLFVIVVACSSQGIAQANGVCTLSDERVDRATQTFAKIANVLRNPRCANCHGGTSPFSPDTEHAGGQYDVIKDTDGFESLKTFKACQECHDDPKEWQVPPETMSFAGKDNVELCKTIKSALVFGPDVLQHFTNDRGGPPFIEVGFKGTRGLNAYGRSLVDNYKPEPIQGMTQSQLLSLAKQWLSDLDALKDVTIGRWMDSDCGCVKHHYALKLHSRVEVNMDQFHYTAGPTTDPVIPIIFDDNGPFHSDATSVALSGAGGGGPCSLQANGSAQVVVKGTVTGDQSGTRPGEDTENMTFTLSVPMASGTGSGSCQGVGTISRSGQGPGGSGKVRIEPPFVGTKSESTPAMSGVPGEGGEAWIEIIQLD